MKMSGTTLGTWRRGVCLGMIAGMLLAACGKTKSPAEQRGPSPWTAILDFRRLAVTDYPKALETYAIAEVLEDALSEHDGTPLDSPDVVMEVDRQARERTHKVLERTKTNTRSQGV